MNRVLVQAFGYDGGWSIERRPSKRAKARERAALWYAGAQGRRERTYAAAPPKLCGGCATPLPLEPYTRGPKRSWCSQRCYFRIYMQRRRASRPTVRA